MSIMDPKGILERDWEEKVLQKAAREAARETIDEAPSVDDLNDELQAMRSVARTLEKLDEAARGRVLVWLYGRFGRWTTAPVNYAQELGKSFR